jgi:hypothetical protein
MQQPVAANMLDCVSLGISTEACHFAPRFPDRIVLYG